MLTAAPATRRLRSIRALAFLALAVVVLALLAARTSSGATETAVFPLAPPTEVRASGGDTITLSWKPSSDENVSGYRILRASRPGGPYEIVGMGSPRTVSGISDDAGVGTFFYVIESIGAGAASAPSPRAAATAT